MCGHHTRPKPNGMLGYLIDSDYLGNDSKKKEEEPYLYLFEAGKGKQKRMQIRVMKSRN